MLHVLTSDPARSDRRNHSVRDELFRRVYGEFQEMPCLRLTSVQARRLFGLRADVCERILTALVVHGLLACEDQRYRFNDARTWPTGRISAHLTSH